MLEKYRNGWGKKEKLYHSYPNSESICLSAKRNGHIANLKKNCINICNS